MIRPLVAALVLAATSVQAAPRPDALKPSGVAGPGINVIDLEAQRAWYEAKLGMAKLRSYDRDGKVFEHIMGYPGGKPGPVLALLASKDRPAGPNRFSRVILQVPDARGLAAWLKGEGVATTEVIPGVAYFLNDPEGNAIELFTPAAAPPK